jgi:hypothetical protein
MVLTLALLASLDSFRCSDQTTFLRDETRARLEDGTEGGYPREARAPQKAQV